MRSPPGTASPVIEDAAQSFGAEYRSRKSCNVSTIGCTSFFPSKPLGCYGDGGAIFVSDAKLADIMRELRVHGQESRYYHTRIGVGARMDTLQCAVILAKLETFDWEVEQRIRIGRIYRDMVAEIPGIQAPIVRNDRTCVWAQFTIQTDRREEIVQSLKEVGVPTAVHYPDAGAPAAGLQVDQSVLAGSLSMSENVSRRVLSLPMHPYLDEATMQTIVHALGKAAKAVALSYSAWPAAGRAVDRAVRSCVDRRAQTCLTLWPLCCRQPCQR